MAGSAILRAVDAVSLPYDPLSLLWDLCFLYYHLLPTALFSVSGILPAALGVHEHERNCKNSNIGHRPPLFGAHIRMASRPLID